MNSPYSKTAYSVTPSISFPKIAGNEPAPSGPRHLETTSKLSYTKLMSFVRIRPWAEYNTLVSTDQWIQRSPLIKVRCGNNQYIPSIQKYPAFQGCESTTSPFI